MRYLVFSDLHFFRGRPYLADTCKWIADTIIQQRPNEVVFCGDLNHSHNYIETDTLHDMAEAISVIASATADVTGHQLWALSGNHDTTLRNSGKNVIEAIAALNDNIHAVTEPFGTVDTLFAPHPPQDKEGMERYMAELIKFSHKQELLFGHLELADVRYTPASPHATDHPFVVPSHVRHIVNGHYHHPDRLEVAGKDIVIVGSPCYHTYADMLVDQPRGVLILDRNSPELRVTRIANPHGPIYHTIETLQIPAVNLHPDVARMMLRVKITDQEDYEKWKPAIMRLREVCKSVRVIGKTAEATTQIYKAETSTISSVDPMSMLQSYVAKKTIPRHIAEYGEKILKGVVK